MQNIKKMVEDLLPDNQEAIKSNENLIWVNELCNTIGIHYQMQGIKTQQGTIYSTHGYNVHMYGDRLFTSIYFRVEHDGVEFNNDKVIYKQCDNELVKKVVDFSTKYFKRTIK